MSAASLIDLYDRLANAPDERTRAKIIAEAFEMLEARYPHLPDLATRQNLSETELKLVKEIEQVRLELTREIEQVRLELTREIEHVKHETEQVRAELKETELRLQKEIEQVRAELKVDIARARANLLQWSFVFWLTQFGAIALLLWRLWPTAG